MMRDHILPLILLLLCTGTGFGQYPAHISGARFPPFTVVLDLAHHSWRIGIQTYYPKPYA